MPSLDTEGLRELIGLVQSGTIRTVEYSGVTASSYDSTRGSVYFLKVIPTDQLTPWILSYRVTTKIIGDDNSTQFADVILGGTDKEIGVYETTTVLYDTDHISAFSHSILMKNGIIYVGVNLGETFSLTHDISVDVKYMKSSRVSCFTSVKLISTLVSDDELSTCTLESIDFTRNGVSNSTIVNPEGLSTVAYTGSYEDLTDKPEILSVTALADELIFTTN